jgi:hypothetical protein
MSKVSQMVADRAAIARGVQSAATVHSPEVAPDLEVLLFPHGAPEKVTVAALADRVRPTARRRAGLPEVEDTVPAQPGAEAGKA